jgi:hypothetical protein
MGRKQTVPASVGGVTVLLGHGCSESQLFRYFYRSVAAIRGEFVAAISKIWCAQPGDAVPFVATSAQQLATLHR